MSCPVDTLPALMAQLEVQFLPPQWFLLSADSSLSLFKVARQQVCSSTKVAIAIQVDEHRQWSLAICGKVLAPASSATFAQIPQVLGSMPCIFQLLNLLESTRLCVGNSEQRFLDVVRCRESITQGIMCD